MPPLSNRSTAINHKKRRATSRSIPQIALHSMAAPVASCVIPLQLELVHPITGEPITDAVVSYSVCRTLEDGTAEIVALGVMPYDGDLGAYTFDVDTSGFVPGTYDVYLGTNDGRFRHFQVEVIQIGV